MDYELFVMMWVLGVKIGLNGTVLIPSGLLVWNNRLFLCVCGVKC